MNKTQEIIQQAYDARRSEGYSADHDDTLVFGELPRAALCLLQKSPVILIKEEGGKSVPMQVWPSSPATFHTNEDRIQQLANAGASLLAEKERLDRLERLITRELTSLLSP